MKNLVVRTHYQFLLALVGLALSCFMLGAIPITASADSIATQTQQILPPGGNSCPQVSAAQFTPYIYSGSLHSFEFTVPDASYVAVAGSVGNTLIPFQFMTRTVSVSNGALRIHVDIETTPITGTLPLRVTMLSAKGPGQPVCAALVTMTIGNGPVQNTPPTSTSYSGGTYGSAGGTQNSTHTSGSTSGTTHSHAGSGSMSGMSSTTMGSTSAASGATAASQSSMKALCQSQESGYRLWLILLVLYALIVGAALWAEFPVSAAWARTPERIATIILVFLVLLLGFWYFSVSCRAALWMPLLGFLIAVLGLLAAYWNHPRVTQMLLIQEPPKR